MRDRLLALLRYAHICEDLLLAGMLIGMILLAAAQILLRNLLDWNFAWGDPVVRVLVLWVGMIGAMAASRQDENGKTRHISVDVLSPLLRGWHLHLSRLLTSLFAAGICGLLCWHCARFVAEEMQFGATGVAGIPVWVFQSVLPAAFAIMTLRFALNGALHGVALFQPTAASPD